MQTRDKKRNIFRGYRHGNKSMPKLSGHARQNSTVDDDDDDDETNKAFPLETALEKANAAVLLDSGNNTLGAIDAYEEAVRLLKGILRTATQDDHTRLQKICDSYVERIRALTSTLTTIPTEHPAETAETISAPIVVKNMQAITEAISPTASSSTSWRLPMSKRKTKSRPTSIVHDDNDNDDAVSAHTVDSAKAAASGSLFASLFAKKGLHAKYNKDYASTHDLSSSSSGPKPSRSTPIAPFNRSPRMWLQQDRKKRHSSDFVDKQGSEQLPPPSLPLPELSTTPNNGDYFDLGSVGASDLLLKEGSSRYSVLRRPSHLTKKAPTEKDDTVSRKRSSITSKLSVAHDSGTVAQNSTQAKVNEAMDTLAKVLEEAEPASPLPLDLTAGSEAEPALVPPPRNQSVPERHSKKDSYDSATVAADEEDCRSTPLVSSSSNNGQGLSSFWRAHTFTTRRANQQRSSKKKQEPSLPPLNLQDSSSTRVRSSSNASATSRKSAAPSSSPTSVSSPSSQTSSRNGWSSFDMQSRPNTLLFSSSMPSLALSPKERTQFSSSEPKIDPAIFMGSPEPNAGVNDLPLTKRILLCLVDGGYLTDRLYVPKQVWNQTNVRLPAVDAKVAACELLIPVLERMSTLQNYDQNQLTEATKELVTLEQVLEQIKECFARKLRLTEHARRNDAPEEACEGQTSGAPEKTSTSYHLNPSTTVSTSKTSTIAAWSNKLSKSVERMKLESSRTSDHQHSTYIQALIQLFTSAQVLDSWRMQYTEIIGRVTQDKVLLYALLLSRLQACAETLEKIVCAFVLRDFTLLLNKWLKRSCEWSIEQ